MPFRVLHGETLDATVARLVGDAQGRSPGPDVAANPDFSYTARLLDEMLETAPGGLGWAAERGRRTLSAITDEGAEEGRVAADAEVVVCVSGSLAHVYFTGHDRPLHLKEIRHHYPGLVESLASHPGVGMVMAAREFGDAVALGREGVRNLITGEITGGSDPLAFCSQCDRWAGELAQLISYPDSGDLVLNGAWLPARERIVVFEEQVSSHGGLGGRKPSRSCWFRPPGRWGPWTWNPRGPARSHAAGAPGLPSCGAAFCALDSAAAADR